MTTYLMYGFSLFAVVCAAKLWPAVSDPRFVVSSVTGVKINPARTGKTSSHPPGTDYYVLDRAYCHREVARFESEKYRNQSSDMRKRMAETRAAELNAWDATL